MQREPFDPADFERIPALVPWVQSVAALLTTGSTNDDAARMATEGAPGGTVVVADAQSAGRGRLGRAWIAEPGTSLHVSWIVRPAPAERQLLPLAAGVAAAAGIEHATGITPVLKWPNDLLCGGLKLGGILAEAVAGDAVAGDAVVIGLGVNVRQSEFPEALAPIATSLLLQRSRPIGRAALLAAILEHFAPFAQAPRACLEEYRRRCDTIGRRVRIEQPDGQIDGTATAVRDDGALLVRTDADAERAIIAGDVVHLRSVT